MREKLEEAIQQVLAPEFDNIQFNEPLWEKVNNYPVVLILYTNDEKTFYLNHKVKHYFEFEIVFADRRLVSKSKDAEFDAIRAMESIIDKLDWLSFNVKVDDSDDTILVLGRVMGDTLDRRIFGTSTMYYGIVGTINYRCEAIVSTDLHF